MASSSSPGAPGVSPPERADALRECLHHPPDAYGLSRSRWRLDDLRQVLPELARYSRSGISRLVHRLGIRRVRGRLALHSPDPAYDMKLAWIERARALASAQPETVRLFYVDETHIQRAPTLAPVYAPQGREPVTRLAPGNDLRQRYAGALDLVRGELTWLSAMRVGTEHVCRLLRKLRRRYPTQRLIVVWDNWQTHLSEAVLFCAAAEAIELLWLPTYAPWTNPIEKLWRWLRQDVLHQHRWAADWTTLLAQVAAFFDRFTDGSPALLRYVGLLPD